MTGYTDNFLGHARCDVAKSPRSSAYQNEIILALYDIASCEFF